MKLKYDMLWRSRYSHQVHGGGARWVWFDQQLRGDLTTRLNLGLDQLQSEGQRWGEFRRKML